MWWILFIILVFACYVFVKWFSISRKYAHIPAVPNGLPILGHIFCIPRKSSARTKFFRNMFAESNSKTNVFWVLLKPIISTIDLDIFSDFLKSQDYISKGAFYKLMSEWLGDSLSMSDREKWKFRRRLLTPAFHFDILHENLKTMCTRSQDFVSYLKNESGKDIEMLSAMKKLTIGIICEAAMGLHYNSFSDNNDSSVKDYIRAVNKLPTLILNRLSKPWFHNTFIYKFSYEGRRYFYYTKVARFFVENVFMQRLVEIDKSTTTAAPSRNFISLLISSFQENKIDVDGIIEEINAFIFAGHDTTATGLSWTLYCLGRSEKAQNKLYKEIMSEIDFENLNYDSIMNLKYLDCVVKESLRLHSPIPVISRFLKNESSFATTKFPAASNVFFNIEQAHRDESNWPDAMSFIPERFLENDNNKHPFAYVPFSAGPRNCIGQRFALLEMKVVIIYLLKNFLFEALQKEDELEEINDIIHRNADGLWFRIYERE